LYIRHTITGLLLSVFSKEWFKKQHFCGLGYRSGIAQMGDWFPCICRRILHGDFRKVSAEVKKRQKNFAYDLEGDMGKRCLAEI
jgi:hypothetical protein